jgi:hypothetical protein
MAANGKALLAAAVAGLMVISVAYWWNRRDDNLAAPRAGCATVVVTASVEKADLIGEVAKRYNASDRLVNGRCYGIAVSAMASGVAESLLAGAGWDPAWARTRMRGRRRRRPGCNCCATTAPRTTGRTSCPPRLSRWSPHRLSWRCPSRWRGHGMARRGDRLGRSAASRQRP